MAALTSLYIKKEILEKILKVIEIKQEKGIELTISINDETNQYGQNISSYVSQTKEQREAKKDKFYVGNGKVFWTDGNIQIADKKDQNSSENSSSKEPEDDLPF